MNFNIDPANTQESIPQLPFFMPQNTNPQIFEEMMKRCSNGMPDIPMPMQWNMIPSIDFSTFRNLGMMPGSENEMLMNHGFMGMNHSDNFKENGENEPRNYGMNRNQSSISTKLEKRPYNKKTNDKIRRWTIEESDKYEEFIKKYNPIMQDTTTKRMTKVFLLMSQYIQTKNPSQCRSHHQKFYPKVRRMMERENNVRLPSSAEINRMRDEIRQFSNNLRRTNILELNEQAYQRQVAQQTIIEQPVKVEKKRIPAKKQDLFTFRLHKVSESICEILKDSKEDVQDEVKIEYDPQLNEDSTVEKKSEEFQLSREENRQSNHTFPFDSYAMNNIPVPSFFPPLFPFDTNDPSKITKLQEEMIMKEQEKLKELMSQFNGSAFNPFNTHSC